MLDAGCWRHHERSDDAIGVATRIFCGATNSAKNVAITPSPWEREMEGEAGERTAEHFIVKFFYDCTITI
jgi:hypothetical protein